MTTTPDLATLPATTWRADLERGEPGWHLAPAHAGIHLGTGRDGVPVALPAPGPAGTRVAVLGESLFGRLFALRLLAVGAHVTAATRVPDQWRDLRQAAGDRLRLSDNLAAWPPHNPAPPTIDAGPQALVSDHRRPPSAAAANGPWRAVLHVTRSAPRRAAFWSHPDALLALDAAYAEPVGRLLGPEAAHHTAHLARGEIILFRATGIDVLRLDISPGETALLTPGHHPAP